MAHLLRFEQGGSYLDLMASPYHVRDFDPDTPNLSTVDAVSEIEDGGERIRVTRRNVAETIDILIWSSGISAATLESKLQDVEKWIYNAGFYQETMTGSPVYLEFQPDGTTGVWRSEVLGGKVQVDSDTLHRWTAGSTVKATILLTRRFYWEGPESELAVSSKATAKSAGGVTIHNHDDSGHGNWIKIDAADVGGVLPAGIRLELTNTYNSIYSTYRYYIGLNNTASMSYRTTVEGESFSGMTQQPGSPDTTNYSSGYYGSFSLSSVSYPVSAFSSADLIGFAGRPYKILARFVSAPLNSDIYLRMGITFPSGTPLTQVLITPEVNLGTVLSIQDLGTLFLPPWVDNSGSNLYPVDLAILPTNTVARTVAIDFLYLMPLDGYRYLLPQGYGLAYQDTVVIDEINRKTWVSILGSGRAGYFTMQGKPLSLLPGKDAKIHVLCDGITGDSLPLRTHSVRVYKRERRLTL